MTAFNPWAELAAQDLGAPYDPVADVELLAEEVKRLQRYRHAAELVKRQQLEEQWKPIPDQGTLGHQLATVVKDPVFMVEETFPNDTICQINAQYKVGKTTLATNLVQSLATGEPFLRRFRVHPKFKGHIAHWNLEVSQNTLLGWYRRQEMSDDARAKVFPLSIRGNLSLNFESDVAVEWTVKWLQNNNIKVWIVDPLSKLYRDDENGNSEFNQWWQKLEHIQQEAKLRLVVLVHHTGHSNDRARGASAMMGNPDVLLSYTHTGNQSERPPNSLRYLSAFGRDVDLPSTEIDFEPATKSLFCTNSGVTRAQAVQAKSEPKAREAGAHVWSINASINTTNLYKALKWQTGGPSSKTNKAALERAVKKQYLVATKVGTAVLYSRGPVDPRTDAGSSK